jgi:hypothetical protein
MVNVYADTPDECDLLVEYVDQHYATWVEVGKHAQATGVVMSTMNATVASPPAAAGQALPQPVQQAAAPAGHMCDCGQPMRLRSSSFGQFYSCSKRMDDPTRCNKKINA